MRKIKPGSRAVTQDLEVRTQVRNNIFHLLGFFDRENLLILSSGFAKKTQKHRCKKSP